MKKRFTQNFSFDSKQIFRLGAILILMFCGVSASRAASNVSMQAERVSGTVVDEKTGEALIGATVQVYGTKKGTVTDYDGKFSVEISDPAKAKLQVSYVNYKSQMIAVKGQTDIKVMLEDNSQELNEVVVLGYGTQTRGASSSAVTTVKAKDLNLNSVSSVDNALQGGVAGLNINMASAAPGSSAEISLRGKLSIEGSNEPLYVIDGVPIMDNSGAQAGGGGGKVSRSPMATINPSDIESVTVLKDASATAIYGSAAANGVILVTTKSGKNGESKVVYDGKFSLQTPYRYFEMMDAAQYMKYGNIGINEYKLYLGNAKDGSYAPYGPSTNVAPSTIKPFFTDEVIAKNTKSYNHMKDIMRNGQIFENNLSFSGGTDNSSYYVSFGSFMNKSLLKSTDFNRYTGRIKLDFKVAKNIKFSNNFMISSIDASNPAVDAEKDGTNINTTRAPMEVSSALGFTPLQPLYDASGNISIDLLNAQNQNPAIWQNLIDRTYTTRMMYNPRFDFTIIKELKLIVQGGYDYSTSNNISYASGNGLNNTELGRKLDSRGGKSITSSYNSNLEAFFDFNKTFNEKHTFIAVLGCGGYMTGYDNFSYTAENVGPAFMQTSNFKLISDLTTSKPDSRRTSGTKLSQFSRITYSYLNRYGLSVTQRVDASSHLDGKAGFFPGISGNWNISNEDFLKSSKDINNLKLRLGYGTTGNETGAIGRNGFTNSYVPYWGLDSYIGGVVHTGVLQQTLRNPNLVWETNIMKNVGLDFAFFENRLSGSLEYYVRTAKDLIQTAALPMTGPVARYTRNIGSTEAKGVELTLGYKIIKTSDFLWDVNFTASHVATYWVERNPAVSLNPWQKQNDDLFAYYGWKTEGKLFQSDDEIVAFNALHKSTNYDPNDRTTWFQNAVPGNPIFKDINGDNKMDTADVVNIGTTAPKFTFGFRTGFTYKSLDFGIQTYGVINQLSTNGWAGSSLPFQESQISNRNVEAMNQWTSVNPNGIYRGSVWGPTEFRNPTWQTDYLMERISFIRIKSVNIGYTFVPKSSSLKKVFKSVRFFLDANNLGVITNYKGFDPEMKGNSPFPIALTTTGGVNLTF